MQLGWIKCDGDRWCPLRTVNLSNVTASGVYIIWHAGSPGRVVRLGQGVIADRLTAHRNDQEILSYASSGTLYVTWAEVASHQMDGIERYLADRYQPLVGEAFPDAVPIVVNAP